MVAAAVATAVLATMLGMNSLDQGGVNAAFDASTTCTAGQDPAVDPCHATIIGTVSNIAPEPGGGGVTVDMSVISTGRTWTFSVFFGSGTNDNLSFTSVGDEATLELWRGVVVTVTTGGATDLTEQAPTTDYRSSLLGLPPALGATMLLLLQPAYTLVRRYGGTLTVPDPPPYPRPARRLIRWMLVDTGVVLFGGLIAAAAVPLAQGGIVVVVTLILAAVGLGELAAATRLALRATPRPHPGGHAAGGFTPSI